MDQFENEFIRAVKIKLGINEGLREDDLALNLDKKYFNRFLRFSHRKDHKSLVFVDSGASVIKAYLSPGTYRSLSDIARSYENSHRENPDLFPEAHKAGEGQIILNDIPYDILFIWQKQVTNPRMDTEEINQKQWDHALEKWDILINRHQTTFPEKLRRLYGQILDGDIEAFRAVTDKYYDSFSFLQAKLAINNLKLRSNLEFLRDFNPPEPPSLQCSKIMGDLTPKHMFSNGPWLSYDVEKYGWGNPASDLSTAIRFYLRKDLEKAIDFFEYLSQRYESPELMKNTYLELIGDKARILIYPHLDPNPQRSKEVLEKGVELYPHIEKYIS